MNTNWTQPSINWFGGYLVARHLLAWTKSEVETADKDSFIAKMNRPNFIQRVMAIVHMLQSYGPTLQAAQTLQQMGWFSGVSAEAIVEKMEEAVADLGSNGVWKFREGEFGSLDFSEVGKDGYHKDNNDGLEELFGGN